MLNVPKSDTFLEMVSLCSYALGAGCSLILAAAKLSQSQTNTNVSSVESLDSVESSSDSVSVVEDVDCVGADCWLLSSVSSSSASAMIRLKVKSCVITSVMTSSEAYM